MKQNISGNMWGNVNFIETSLNEIQWKNHFSSFTLCFNILITKKSFCIINFHLFVLILTIFSIFNFMINVHFLKICRYLFSFLYYLFSPFIRFFFYFYKFVNFKIANITNFSNFLDQNNIQLLLDNLSLIIFVNIVGKFLHFQ